MILESVITCPHCATAKSETMPTDACQFFYTCTGCGATVRPKPGDCCVFWDQPIGSTTHVPDAVLRAHYARRRGLGRLRLRGPRGAQFEFTLAAIAQNLRRLAKLVARPPPLVASLFGVSVTSPPCSFR